MPPEEDDQGGYPSFEKIKKLVEGFKEEGITLKAKNKSNLCECTTTISVPENPSPDSRSVGAVSGGELLKVSVVSTTSLTFPAGSMADRPSLFAPSSKSIVSSGSLVELSIAIGTSLSTSVIDCAIGPLLSW